MLGIYCRTSTETQKENFSISDQINIGKEFAEKNNYTYKLYIEESVSGSTLERPEFQSLKTDIENKKITKVHCVELTRLSRNTGDGYLIRELFQKNNIELFVLGRKIDLENLTDRFLYGMEILYAETERERIRQRTMNGKKQKRDSGEGVIVGRKFFGYDFQFDPNGKKIFTIQSEQAETIRRIYNLYFTGSSLADIKNKIEDELRGSFEGRKWSTTQIRKILQRILYTGHCYNSKGEIIRSTVYPEIVPLDRYIKIQKTWKENISNNSVSIRYTPHMLSSVIRCAHCGYGFAFNCANVKSTKMSKGSYVSNCYITCTSNKHYFSQNITEFVFNTLVKIVFGNEQYIEEYFNVFHKEQLDLKHEIETDLRRYKAIHDKIKKEKANIVNAISKGIIDEDDAKDKMLEIKERESEIIKKLKQTEAQEQLTAEEYEYLVEIFSEDSLLRFLASPDSIKRNILHDALESATVDNDRNFVIKFKNGIKFLWYAKSRANRYAYVSMIVGDEEPVEIILNAVSEEVSFKPKQPTINMDNSENTQAEKVTEKPKRLRELTKEEFVLSRQLLRIDQAKQALAKANHLYKNYVENISTEVN